MVFCRVLSELSSKYECHHDDHDKLGDRFGDWVNGQVSVEIPMVITDPTRDWGKGLITTTRGLISNESPADISPRL